MGGGHSGITQEQKQRAKSYAKMKKEAKTIKDDYNETMIVFDENGNLLFRRTDNKHSEVGFGETPEERHENWYNVQNNILVHNHPEGSCFSGEDLENAVYMKEIWAVTSERIQIFRWNQNYYNNEYIRSGIAEKHQKFIKMVKEMNDGAMWVAARDEYDKTHDKSEMYKLPFKDFEMAQRLRLRAIERLANKKTRKFFKNHAKEYGFTFTERKWTKDSINVLDYI